MPGATDRSGESATPPSTIYDIFGEDEEDDDIYEPATDQSTDIDGQGETEQDDDEYEDEDDDEDEEDEFLDVIETGGPEVTIEFTDEADGDEGQETETEQNGAQRTTENTRTITLAELNQLIGRHAAIRRLFRNNQIRFVNEDDDDDEEYDPWGLRRRRRRKGPLDPKRFPKIPSEAGSKLMSSGIYGQRESHIDIRRHRKRTIHEKLLWRRLGLDPRSTYKKHNRLIAQEMVPTTTRPDHIIHYDSRAYSGQFSDDGNFFFSCTQNFKVRMYDTSNPFDWKYYKTVDYPYGQWTITDATLSPDNRFLAYSSIRHTVCLAPTDPTDNSEHTLLDFTNYAPGADAGDPRAGYMGRTHGFGIWSLRFSGDGREIVAGTSDSAVLVYDVETRKTTLKLCKHTDDVNAVCFGDKMSPHILYSGSDDQTLRVWDRRSMADRREAGVFVGHTEGLTYVDSKGDGRYVLSNGKDQMMKLWDLRKMTKTEDFDKMNLSQYTTNFDYRFAPYDEDEYVPNPHDCSVVTFRGHSVLKTLIRCHFSPPTSSNSRYVYTGSEDGKVWIYNMDGTVKSKIDVHAATKNSRSKNNEHIGYEYDVGQSNSSWKTCVRDASWSSTAPVIAATSWNGWGMATGTVSVHSWNDGADDDEGYPQMGVGYNGDKPDMTMGVEGRTRVSGRNLRSRRVPARPAADDTEDNDNTGAGW